MLPIMRFDARFRGRGTPVCRTGLNSLIPPCENTGARRIDGNWNAVQLYQAWVVSPFMEKPYFLWKRCSGKRSFSLADRLNIKANLRAPAS